MNRTITLPALLGIILSACVAPTPTAAPAPTSATSAPTTVAPTSTDDFAIVPLIKAQ